MPGGRRTDVSLAAQALALRRLLPGSTLRLDHGRLCWKGEVRPSHGCGEYQLRLEARAALPPKIFVESPALRPDAGGRLPHIYSDGSLCVSRRGDWRPDMLFIHTYLPWSLEWLIYYELWLASGLWYGDGPDMLDPASQARILHPYR